VAPTFVSPVRVATSPLSTIAFAKLSFGGAAIATPFAIAPPAARPNQSTADRSTKPNKPLMVRLLRSSDLSAVPRGYQEPRAATLDRQLEPVVGELVLAVRRELGRAVREQQPLRARRLERCERLVEREMTAR